MIIMCCCNVQASKKLLRMIIMCCCNVQASKKLLLCKSCYKLSVKRVWYCSITRHLFGSLSKYTYFFLFIFWWHQIFSFKFFFNCLVLPILQWYIHIICSRENHHEKNYFKICCSPSYLSVRGVTNIKLFFAGK
jgi:hypothetical protein